ncbi:MAG: Copper chaperone CopZ [Candidatus Woesebacteria bacterium]|jgi:copper chaperone CopZ|nr:MAG: Copper chaperone CopZ [Candidatus Woesebacteria bacterium]
MAKKIYKVEGMNCDACAKMIELDLEDEGVVAMCDYAKSSLEIEIEDKKTEDKVKEVLRKGGYLLVEETNPDVAS